jgi:predicted phage replisome organizer
MAEVKWIKINTSMFDDEKIKLIDAVPERDTIHYIWMRLLVQAGKTNSNGQIFLNEKVNYSEEMLSIIFNRPINSIRLALKTLCQFGMIDLYEDNLIRISNWEKHQNIEGMERVREQNRLRKQRQRSEEKKKLLCEEEDKNRSRDGHVTVTVQKEIENKIENKKEDIEKERELEENTALHSLTLLKHYEEITGITGGLNVGALKVAIRKHGSAYVKRAIDKAVEVNKPNMTYINGILRNWAKEGYPEEVNNNGIRSITKNNGAASKGSSTFKLHKPRELTDEEREAISKELL